MAGQMPSEQNEIRDDCSQPATTYRTLFRLLVLEGFLPNHTQNVERDHCQFQYEGVGFEFAGRQPFDVHICLELAVILLALSMSVVGFDDLVI